MYRLLALLLLAPLPVSASDGDRQLAYSLLAVTQNRLPDALGALDQLTRTHPNFRLAQLIKGDLLLAHARPLRTLGDTGRSAREIEQLRLEARQRIRALTEPPPQNKVPNYLLSLPDNVRHVLVADASRSRLYVFENRDGRPALVDDLYVAIGKAGMGKEKEGDNRTPVGIYTVGQFKPSNRLPDLYGSGAWTLDYPNEWDRRLGRTGHGIWIHGSPSDTYSRGPQSSEGCVVLSNDDFDRLGRYVEAGKTPVVISEQIEWVAYDTLDARRAELATALDTWRDDWESRDVARLLSHYSPDFRNGQQPFAAFAAHKRRVNVGKTRIEVGLNRVGIKLYPDRPNLALVNFEQDYQSNNFSSRTIKRQFWSRVDGRWRIIHETTL